MQQDSISGRPASIPIFYGVRTQPGLQDTLTGPCIHVDPARDKPLRLNDGALDIHGKADTPDAFARIRDVLASHCDPWSRNHLLFIDRYFAFIEDQCDKNRALLEDILAPFGSVYDYRDFRFSAWLPLPLACIATGSDIAGASAPVRADFLFRSDTGFIAAELCGHTSRSRKRSAELEKLQSAGMTVIEISIDALREDLGAVFTSIFPPAFSEFWVGQPFPSGPLGPGISRFALNAALRT